MTRPTLTENHDRKTDHREQNEVSELHQEIVIALQGQMHWQFAFAEHFIRKEPQNRCPTDEYQQDEVLRPFGIERHALFCDGLKPILHAA